MKNFSSITSPVLLPNLYKKCIFLHNIIHPHNFFLIYLSILNIWRCFTVQSARTFPGYSQIKYVTLYEIILVYHTRTFWSIPLYFRIIYLIRRLASVRKLIHLQHFYLIRSFLCWKKIRRNLTRELDNRLTNFTILNTQLSKLNRRINYFQTATVKPRLSIFQFDF